MPAECGNGNWKLDDAGSNPNLEDVTYNEQWTPVLKEIARCVSERQTQGSCLDIRGHSDAIQFSPAVIAAYGSAQAAQMVRARSRSEIVISKLHGMGVKPQLLRLIPPSFEPTFRGVSIELVPECVNSPAAPPGRTGSPDAAESTPQVPEALRGGPSGERAESAPIEKAKPDSSSDRRADESAVALPKNSFWLGVRAGIALPAGDLYRAEADAAGGPTYQDVADVGPGIELDAGMRIKRVFLLFAFWEHAWLGGGGAEQWSDYAGGQQSQLTDYVGVAGRWSIRPWRRSGVDLEIGTGYRWLGLNFSDQTEIDLGSPLETRVCVGYEYLVSSGFTLEAMLQASGGIYTARSVDYSGSSSLDLGGKDRFHAMFSLAIGGHYDVPLAK